MEGNFSRTTQKVFYGFDTITFNHNLQYRFLYFLTKNINYTIFYNDFL